MRFLVHNDKTLRSILTKEVANLYRSKDFGKLFTDPKKVVKYISNNKNSKAIISTVYWGFNYDFNYPEIKLLKNYSLKEFKRRFL